MITMTFTAMRSRTLAGVISQLAVVDCPHAPNDERGLHATQYAHEQRADGQREEVRHDVYRNLVHEQKETEPERRLAQRGEKSR